MRAEEYITERATSVLFHYTTPGSALDILKTREFKLSNSFSNNAEKKFSPPGYPFYMSATRSKVGDYHSVVGNSAVMFVLDGDWFSSRYPVKPVDYWEQSWLQARRTSESEDRIFSKEPTIPINGVRAIHVLLKNQHSRNSSYIRQILLIAKTQGIPAYLYTQHHAWMLQDTRRAVSITQAANLLRGNYTPGPDYYRRTKYLEPWIELIMKRNYTALSNRAKRIMGDLVYYGVKHDTDDFGLSQDINNSRKPDSHEYQYAARITGYLSSNGMKTADLARQLSDKWKKIRAAEKEQQRQVVAEREWERDDTYTEEDIRKIHSSAMAVENYAHKNGISLRFSKHFFDRAIAKRGEGKITYELLLNSCAKLIKRGLNYFRDKPVMTSYAFQDNNNAIILEVLKHSDTKFEVRTIVRDLKWFGRSQKIVYED